MSVALSIKLLTGSHQLNSGLLYTSQNSYQLIIVDKRSALAEIPSTLPLVPNIIHGVFADADLFNSLVPLPVDWLQP
jgi:hypothetical protein